MRTFLARGTRATGTEEMASRPATRDSVRPISPVIGVGLAVAITLAAAIAVGFLAVVVVG